MKLYTIEIVFADFTKSIEQYEASSPGEAVELFFSKAACFEGYDRKELTAVIKKRLGNDSLLIHAAGDLRGVWLINTGGEFIDVPEGLEAIYGGFVVQTDPHGPRRSR